MVLVTTAAAPPVVRALPARLIASIAGVDVRTVERWRTRVQPRPRHRRRLEEIEAVLAILGSGMTDRAKQQWLEAPNVALDWERPVDVLARGDFREVVGAARAYAAGDVS